MSDDIAIQSHLSKGNLTVEYPTPVIRIPKPFHRHSGVIKYTITHHVSFTK